MNSHFDRFPYMQQTPAIIHYSDVIMGAMASSITNFKIVKSIVIQAQIKEKNKGSASLAFVRGFRRLPVHSPHKGPVTRKMFPFDDVFMI